MVFAWFADSQSIDFANGHASVRPIRIGFRARQDTVPPARLAGCKRTLGDDGRAAFVLVLPLTLVAGPSVRPSLAAPAWRDRTWPAPGNSWSWHSATTSS